MADLYFKAAALTDRKTRKFNLDAYNGGELAIDLFDVPTFIDLEGVSFASNVVLLVDHNPDRMIGHAEQIDVKDGKITAEGVISRSNVDSWDVVESAENGFPWQCSVGGPLIDYIELAAGETLEVNGRQVCGPAAVVTKLEIREISFVALGADDTTSATLAAKRAEAENISVPLEKEIVMADEKTLVTDQNESAEKLTAYRKEMAEETRRVEAIRKAAGGQYAELEAKAIEEGWTAERAELEMLRASRAEAPKVKSAARTESAVLECVAMRAAGVSSARLEKRYDEKTLEAAYKLRGIGLQEFCAMASGAPLPHYRSDASGWLRAAFSNASLPNLLSNVANKALLEGYNYAEDAWRKIAKITSVPDFKTAARYRLDASAGFTKVAPGGELKHGSLGEGGYTNKAETYGVMFAVDRQMLINDDLGALSEIPKQIGVAAGEAIAQAVWAAILGNAGSFFGAGNHNLVTGADYVLAIAGLDKGYATFMAQTKPSGMPLGVQPTKLVVPGCLAITAQQLMTSTMLVNGTTKANPAANPFVGKFEVVASSYLDNAAMSGYSATAWYLFADPDRVPAVEVAFLNGADRPTIEQSDADFNTLGIQFRGYADFGVALGDPRGAVKVTGAAA
ncbi:MAG: Mu-like prophage major head subunit gpT family protein [Thermoguttaceae bacterium]|nr:Mu-like prophage major head subunit gpT family protein [Thermoguttaceae bacterium]